MEPTSTPGLLFGPKLSLLYGCSYRNTTPSGYEAVHSAISLEDAKMVESSIETMRMAGVILPARSCLPEICIRWSRMSGIAGILRHSSFHPETTASSHSSVAWRKSGRFPSVRALSRMWHMLNIPWIYSSEPPEGRNVGPRLNLRQ